MPPSPSWLCRLWRLRNAPPVLLGGLAIGCMLPMTYFSYLGGPRFEYVWLLRIAGGFLAGAFACLAVRRINRSTRLDVWAPRVALAAAVEIAVGLWWADWRGEGDAGYAGVVAFLFPVLVGSLALSTRGLSRLLGTRPMVHGGRISFALYLVHIPVFEMFWTFLQWYPGFGPDSLVGTFLKPHVLIGTVVLAHLAYRYVEEPARRALRRREPFRRPPAATEPVPAATAPVVAGARREQLVRTR
jgi:peptidoglycan/LPS O-acetylase OafA/YrhL